MDGLTHIAAGLLTGEAVEPRPGRTTTSRIFWAALSIAPDLDGLTGLGGPLWYFAYHRRIGHGLPGVALLVLAGAFFYRRLGLGTFRRGLAMAALALGGHLFLDVVTAFGTTLFYPYGTTDYALDLLFIVDLAFTTVLLVFLVLAWRRGPRFARLGLVAAGLYLTAAVLARHRVETVVAARIGAGDLPPGVVTVIPQPPTLLHWAAFDVTPRGTWAGLVTVFGDRPDWTFHPVPADGANLARANDTPAARRFLAFARIPVVREVANDDGSTSFFYEDLRFSMSGHERANRYFGSRVDLGPDGTVLREGLANP